MQIEIQHMIEFAPYPMSVFDSEGNLVLANKKWRKLWKLENKKSLINLSESKILNKMGIDLSLSKLLKLKEPIKTKPVLYEEIDFGTLSRKSSNSFIFHLNALSDKQKKRYLIIMTEDVTEELKKLDVTKELEIQKRNNATILEVLENERKRIAKELHDVIGQKLVVAKLNIEFFQKNYDEEATELQKSKQNIQEISKEIKAIIQDLHPVIIEKYQLRDAINLLVQNFTTDDGMNISTNFYGEYPEENKQINLNIYRILQEALTNISKHAEAKKVKIELFFSKELITGQIEDDGKGFDTNPFKTESRQLKSYGLISMRERANILSGDFQIESTVGLGTKIIFHIPLEKYINEI